MVTTIIVIAVLLILAILVMLVRIETLISVMRGRYQKRVGLSNKVNGALLLIFLICGLIGFFWISSVASKDYLPEAVSEHGKITDRMFWVTMGILVFAFIVTNIFLFVFAFRYQYQEGRKAFFYPENNKLEIVWTVIPAIVMSILVFYGWTVWSGITAPEPKNSEVIEVMGKQFAWQVRYPGPDGKLGSQSFKLIDATNVFGLDFTDPKALDDFTPPEIHLPKGKPVLFTIRARDVLHSVYAPHFRLKMDAVPGMPTKFWFVPTKTTKQMRDETSNPNFNYELACAEVCGRGHFAMRYIIVVEEPEEYEAWKKQQKSFAEVNIDYVRPKVPEKYQKLLPAPQPTAAAMNETEVESASSVAPSDSVNSEVPADSVNVASEATAMK